MTLCGSLALSILAGIVALDSTSAFPARWMFKNQLQNRLGDRPLLCLRCLRRPPNTGDPCSAVLQYGSIQSGITSVACAGTGSGTTYAPAHQRHAPLDAALYAEWELRCEPPGLAGSGGCRTRVCRKAEQFHAASPRPRPHSQVYNSTCSYPPSTLDCLTPDNALFCSFSASGVSRCVYSSAASLPRHG